MTEADSLTTTFASMFTAQRAKIADGAQTFQDSMTAAAKRLDALFQVTPANQAGAPASAAPSAGTGLSVFVTNDFLKVKVAGKEAEKPSGGAGFWGSIMGVVGSIGSLIAGLGKGFLTDGMDGVVKALQEARALATEASGMLDKIKGMLDDAMAFGRELVGSISLLVGKIFESLTSAGIFPLSSFFDTLLKFIDVGVAVVLAHLKVVMDWAEGLLETVVDWLAKTTGVLAEWLGTTITKVGAYLRDALGYLLVSVATPAVLALYDALLERTNAFLAQFAGSWRDTAANLLANLLIVPIMIQTVMAEGAKLFWNVGKAAFQVLMSKAGLGGPPDPLPVTPGFDQMWVGAQENAKKLSISLFAKKEETGKPAEAPAAPKVGGGLLDGLKTPVAKPGGWLDATGPPAAMPVLMIDDPKIPRIGLQRMPEITPLLDKVRERVAAPPELPVLSPHADEKANKAVTFNGGITVHVTANSVDAEHAEETARTIAGTLLTELRRLSDRDRFRAGLPATSPG